MTVAPHAIPFVLLATVGERLGWSYIDRNLYRRKFLEAPPQQVPVSQDLHDLLNRAQDRRKKRVGKSIRYGILVSILTASYGAFQVDKTGDPEAGSTPFTLSVIVFLGGFAAAIFAAAGPAMARRAISVAESDNMAAFLEAQNSWENRRDEHARQQEHLIDTMPEWSAVAPATGTRRVDIIGGTTNGWEAVLTVYGGSLLATRGSMTLVDLTGNALCAELVQLATATGRSVRRLRLPTQLDEFDLLAGLAPEELVDCLVEAMHGDAQGAVRAERSQDTLLLREIGEVLGGGATIAKLLAALRVLTDRPDRDTLTPEETERLLDLQPDESRRQLYPQLRRIESFLHPLKEMGRRAEGAGPADLTCLVADGEGGNAQNDLFKDLLLHWLTRLVRRGVRPMGSLVIMGADDIHHRSIEKLSTLCERHGVRLVLFFSHLRAESVHTIGGGDVALMRLGNHHEANQAAEYIGRNHRFVVSQHTRTLGGGDTHTLGDTHGVSDAEGGSGGMSFGKRGKSRDYGKNWGRTRIWSQGQSTARGTSWSDAATVQRVHEYTVEPRVLQDLPEFAMVLVKEQDRETVVQAVEVDPAIVMLPRVVMHTAKPPPLPDPVEAVVPVTRQAGLRQPVPQAESRP